MRRLCVVLGICLAAGCAPTGGAEQLFAEARYPEARHAFQRLERNYRRFDARDRARYALYRGLCELALGHAPLADLWLSRAVELSRADRDLYSASEYGQLEAARRSMGHMPGDRGGQLPGDGAP